MENLDFGTSRNSVGIVFINFEYFNVEGLMKIG